MPAISQATSLAEIIQNELVQAHLCIAPAGQRLSAPPVAGPNPHYPTHPAVHVGRGRPAITYRQSRAHRRHHIHHCRGRQSGDYVGPCSACAHKLVLFGGGAR